MTSKRKGNPDNSRDIVNELLSQSDFLSDEEAEQVILNLAGTRGEEGFTEDEGMAIINWAIQTRIDSAVLDNVIKGTILVDVDKTTNDLMFKISSLGKKIVDKMIINHITKPIDN